MSSPFADTRFIFLIVRHILSSVPRYTQANLAKDIKEAQPDAKKFSAQYLSELLNGRLIVSKEDAVALRKVLSWVMEKRKISLDLRHDVAKLKRLYQADLRNIYGNEILVAELGKELVNSAVEDNNELKIDIVCYSSETFVSAFDTLFHRMVSDAGFLKKLVVRLLVWSCEGNPVLPVREDKERDMSYLSFISQRRSRQVMAIRSFIDQMRGERKGLEIEFTVKMSPFEPSFKAIIINRSRAFWTLYRIGRVTDIFKGQEHANWDYRGHGLTFVEVDETYDLFEAISGWFETIWDNFAFPCPR